ncbi:MAG: hypothetical protein ACOWWR_02160 [Eubacteriales bacterium]
MIDYDRFTNALGGLQEREILAYVSDFINSNPDEEGMNNFMKSAGEGINIVKDYYEKGVYNVGDLIFAKEILSDILNIMEPMVHASVSFSL